MGVSIAVDLLVDSLMKKALIKIRMIAMEAMIEKRLKNCQKDARS